MNRDEFGWMLTPLGFVVACLLAIVIVLLGWLGSVYYLVSFS
jgi:hypothetical protein